MKPWSFNEYKFLEENLNILSLPEIAEKLNRTYSSVYGQMTNLGLKQTRKYRRRNRKRVEYAVYQGEEHLVTGTAEECAEKLGIEPDTIKWLTTPSGQKRIANRKNPDRARTAVRLDDDDE